MAPHSATASAMLTLLLFALVVLGDANPVQNHFGSPCVLCKCFVYYTDRDLPVTLEPYEVAETPYDTTEDRCLAQCLRNSSCQSAAYGWVGGREVFTCELYSSAPPGNPVQLITENYINTYVRKSTCDVDFGSLEAVRLVDDKEYMEASTKRKHRATRIMNQRNPFYAGR